MNFLEEKGGENWILTALETNRTRGLIGNDFAVRERVFGNNKPKEVPPKSYL